MLREPALILLQEIYEQLELIATNIINNVFARFPASIPMIMDIILSCITKELKKAKLIVEALLDSEENYPFTNDKDY